MTRKRRSSGSSFLDYSRFVFEYRGQVVSLSASLGSFFRVPPEVLAGRIRFLLKSLPDFYAKLGKCDPAQVPFQREAITCSCQRGPVWRVNAEGVALLLPYLEGKNPQDTVERRCAVLKAYREAQDKWNEAVRERQQLACSYCLHTRCGTVPLLLHTTEEVQHYDRSTTVVRP